MTFLKSMLLRVTSIPNSPRRWTMRTRSAGYTRIFVGMHPTVRQMPPGSLLSITATLMSGLPSIAVLTKFIAEPVPMTMKSYSLIPVTNDQEWSIP